MSSEEQRTRYLLTDHVTRDSATCGIRCLGHALISSPKENHLLGNDVVFLLASRHSPLFSRGRQGSILKGLPQGRRFHSLAIPNLFGVETSYRLFFHTAVSLPTFLLKNVMWFIDLFFFSLKSMILLRIWLLSPLPCQHTRGKNPTRGAGNSHSNSYNVFQFEQLPGRASLSLTAVPPNAFYPISSGSFLRGDEHLPDTRIIGNTANFLLIISRLCYSLSLANLTFIS